MPLIMNVERRLRVMVDVIALTLVIALGQTAATAASTELNLSRCQQSASTVDFTPQMFTAMTGVAPDQGVLVIGPLVGQNTYQLQLKNTSCDCTNAPIVCGLATLRSRERTALFDAEVMVPDGTQAGSAPTVQINTTGVEATYDIVTYPGWSGTVRGARITFTATEGGTTNSATMTGFYPAELVLATAVGLPSKMATITQLADTVVDCDDLSEKSCYQLRLCFNAFDTCMAIADSTYDITVATCGDFSTTLKYSAAGAVSLGGLGCLGGPLGGAVGCVVGGVAGGTGGYFYCLRDARNARRVARATCCVTLDGCVNLWLLTQGQP